ncbi:MAG: hypothetical protein AABW45_01385, partial [Nanoarchaeota archaeon]
MTDFKKIEDWRRNETNVKNLVALVVNPKHPRFGQIGRLEAHDLNEGYYDITFLNRKLLVFKKYITELILDGLEDEPENREVWLYYRLIGGERAMNYERQGCGLKDLKAKYFE